MRSRTVVLLLALTVAAPAIAFRSRPVSDLRFEDRLEGPAQYLSQPNVVAVASDGNDYVILLDRFLGGTYAQVVSHGVPYGPAVLVGVGDGGSVVWTGSHYLVAWSNQNGAYLSAVSRRGALLSEPKLVIARKHDELYTPKAATDGRRVLVTLPENNGLRAALTDLDGEPVGETFTMVASLRTFAYQNGYALTGTGDGFALALFGNETRVFRFDDAAKPVLAGGARIDGPIDSSDVYGNFSGMIASDGMNVAVIFASGHSSSPYGLKTAIVGPHGDIVQETQTILPYGVTVSSALWNGSEYAAALWSASGSSQSLYTPMLQRISRTGERLDEPLLIFPAPGDRTPSAVASDGREYLLALQNFDEGASFVRVPIGSTAPINAPELTRSIDTQASLAIARGPRDYLAAWLETDRTGVTVRASRIDPNGRYLDGTGIVIASLPLYQRSYDSVSVDSDGENWLVVWSDGNIHGCRVSPDGVLLDPQSISISQGYGGMVRWGGNAWLIVSTLTDRLVSNTVSRGGVAGTLRVFDRVPAALAGSGTSYGYPALAFDGQQFVLAVGLDEGSCDFGTCTASVSIVTERLGLSGDVVAGSRFTLPPDNARDNSFSIATNGSQDLIVSRRSDKIEGLLLNRGSSAPTTIAIADSGLNSATMWNGTEFLVAVSTDDGVLQLVHTSAQGIVGGTITLPRDPDEQALAVALPPSSLAVQTTTPDLGLPLAFVTQHRAYEGVPRAAFAFIGDVLDSLVVQPVPVAPTIGKVIGDPTGVTLTWEPQDNVLGFAIELRQFDGSERVIGIAAGSASSTHISYGGLQGTTLRLRAWNAAGLSSPSSEVQPSTRLRAVAK